jgi:4a-hydroxytetrahydrobiopterin dehydratase
MKKFRQILENINNQKYFEISAEIKLVVSAENEGESGYLADSILGGVEEQTDFTIQNIAEISKEEYQKYFESYNSSKNADVWGELFGKLEKTFQFKDFKEAVDFIIKVAEISEKMKHHPEILNDYNKVTLKLKTHDKNQITELDYKFAKKVDDLFNI